MEFYCGNRCNTTCQAVKGPNQTIYIKQIMTEQCGVTLQILESYAFLLMSTFRTTKIKQNTIKKPNQQTENLSDLNSWICRRQHNIHCGKVRKGGYDSISHRWKSKSLQHPGLLLCLIHFCLMWNTYDLGSSNRKNKQDCVCFSDICAAESSDV